MAKGQTQASQSMANQNFARANQQGTQTQNMLWGQLPGAQQQAQQTYGQAAGAYNNYMGGTGSYDPAAYQTQTETNTKNQATGGYNADQLNQLRNQQSSNINTGGYDPAKMSQLQKGYTDLTSGGVGGIDPAQMTKLRSSYSDMIDPNSSVYQAQERQAASGAQSVYSTMGQNLARQGTAQGITAGGETAQMARQASQASATAITGAKAAEGQERISAMGGLGGLETSAAGLQQSALSGQASLAGQEAANRLAATAGSAGTEADVAHGSLNAAAAQQELASGAATQRIQAAGGLTQLYNSSPGYVNSIVQQIMQSQSQTGQLTAEQAQIMAELSKNPGLAQTIIGDITALAGAAGGVMTGIGKLP